MNKIIERNKEKIHLLGRGCAGFTLAELLIVISVLVLITGSIYPAYSLSQQAYREAEISVEMEQNGRVILERLSRELRQTKGIITELPDDESGATSTIIFQDGHDITSIRYIHFFKDGTNIKREVIAYYFSGDLATYVLWNAISPPGQERLTTTTEEAKVIGEYVNSLKFWSSPVINIFITLEKNNKSINLRTKILGRNL